MKQNNTKKFIITILVLGLAAVLAGCIQAAAAEAGPEQLLRLVPVAGEMPEDAYTYPQFSSEDLKGNYGGTLCYDNFTEVRIDLDGNTLPLEDAISQGLIYGEELQSMAQVDARNQYCVESNYTENGKTWFHYRYDGYTLEILNDVYETPDGNAYLLRETWIHPSEASLLKQTKLTNPDPDRDPFDLIDKEDWGLTLTITQSLPTGLTLKCEQTGGQQFGTLKAYRYYVYSYSEDTVYHPTEALSQELTMEGATEFAINWDNDKTIGKLPKGEYLLRLYIQDIYKAEDVPPLSRDFHTQQMYQLNFRIE